MATIGLLSVLGVTIAVNERAWATAIAVFSGLAAIGVALGYPRHRSAGPPALAALAVAAILWALYGSYSAVLEAAGFASLVVATFWDQRGRRRAA